MSTRTKQIAFKKTRILKEMKGTNLECWYSEYEDKWYARKTMEEVGSHRVYETAEGSTPDEALSNLIDKLI